MKNLKSRFNSITLAIGVTSILSLSLMGMGSWYQKGAVKQMSLSSGVGTCFQRVSQTFTALMISDFSSNYIQKPFMDTTSECFSYAAKEFESLYGKSFSSANKTMTAINSDIHWFHEKAIKLLKMSRDQGLDLSNSNIINKYSSLEGLRESLHEKMNARVEKESGQATILSFAGIAGILFSFLLFGLSLYRRFEKRKLFAKIENESEKAMNANSEFVSANIERSLDNVLTKVNMPKTYALFNKYHADLLEKAYRSFESSEGIEVDAPIIPEVPVSDLQTAYYQDAINNVLDNFSQKAFSHGIVIDADLEDDFHVKGDSEALEQVLYNVINFASERSLNQVESRKLLVKTKPLGGTAYLKVGINNYCFNATELDYVSGANTDETNIDLNLVLVQALVKDLGASLSIKNKMDAVHNLSGCEIEIIFERIDTRDVPKKVTSVMKGSKKDILRALSTNI